MPPSRFVRLTEQVDARLRRIEQDPLLKPKVRLRAQVLRLSHRGSNMAAVAAYTGRGAASVLRDLDRWEQRGFEGLADGTAPGNPPRVTAEVRAFVEGKLSEERTWRDAARRRDRGALRAQGDAGGRAPAPQRDGILVEAHALLPLEAPADPEEEREAREELEGLKKGLRRGSSS